MQLQNMDEKRLNSVFRSETLKRADCSTLFVLIWILRRQIWLPKPNPRSILIRLIGTLARGPLNRIDAVWTNLIAAGHGNEPSRPFKVNVGT